MLDQRSSFYANAVNILVNIYDFTLDLKSQSPKLDQAGNILELQKMPLMEVNDEIVVRMSPQHAKALATVLAKNVIEYEKRFNLKLPLPEDLEIMWNDVLKKD